VSIRRGVAALAVAAALSGCADSSASTVASKAVARTLHGSVPAAPAARPRFTLTDTTGAPYDFAARTAGRVTLLFWGYTHCPDTCPAVLHDISLALQSTPEPVRRRVIVVFVTSDPRRDTVPVVRRWLEGIDASFVGLTGTHAQIAAVETATGVPHAVRPAGKRSGYAVEHFAGITAYGRDDRVAVVYPSNAVVGDFAADLPTLVREEPIP